MLGSDRFQSENYGWHEMVFIWETSNSLQDQEIKYLSGGVVLYAAQTNMQIDIKIVEDAVSG